MKQFESSEATEGNKRACLGCSLDPVSESKYSSILRAVVSCTAKREQGGSRRPTRKALALEKGASDPKKKRKKKPKPKVLTDAEATALE